MALNDCDVTTIIETIDSSLTVGSVVIAATSLTQGGVSVPGLGATWSAPASMYVTGIEFQYQESSLASGLNQQRQQIGALSWSTSSGLVPGKTYAVRWRAVGNQGTNTFGPWSAPTNILITGQLVSGDTTHVGGQSAQDLLDSITDLYTIYGSTASAAASASAAAAAQVLAEQARDDAEAAFTAADAARDDAVAQASAAAGSASAAAGSATVSTTKANEASGSASVALAQAAIATTKAGDAAGSASAAATSATGAASSSTAAGNSASAAQTSAVSAQAVANVLIPDRPARKVDFASNSTLSGTPDTVTLLTAGTVVAVAGEGDVLEAAASLFPGTRGWLPISTGRTFRFSTRVRVTVNGVDNQAVSGFSVFNAAGTFLGSVSYTVDDANFVVADGWQTFSKDVSSAGLLASYPTGAYVRGSWSGGRNTGSNTSGATWQTAFARLQDVTSEAAAAGSASAAASSASSAAASQTAAGTSASTATTQAGIATTKAGEASTSAGNAATSETNAAGSASSAATYSVIAANASNAATTTAASTLPSTFGQDGQFWTAQHATYTNPASLSPTSIAGFTLSWPTVGSVGKVMQIERLGNGLTTPRFGVSGLLPLKAGRTYGYAVRSRVTVNPSLTAAGAAYTGNLKSYAFFNVFAADGTFLQTLFPISDYGGKVADGWMGPDTTVPAASLLAVQPTAAYVRAGLSSHYNDGGSTNVNGTIQVEYLRFSDVTDVVAAASSASAAASSASAASASQTAAGTSASTATTQAGIATTKAGEASTHAGNAATSETNAAGSASSAASSSTLAATARDTANMTAAFLMPSDFNQDGRYWFDSYTGAAQSVTPITANSVYSFPTVAGIGKVIQIATAGVSRDVGGLGSAPVYPGRRYRVTTSIRVLSTVVGTPTYTVYVVGLNAAQTAVTTPGATFGFAASNTWYEQSNEVTGDSLIAGGASLVRPMVRLLGASGANTFQIRFIRTEDVTALVATAGSATAAATSASNASASETAAGLSATSATTSANTATTQAGNSSTSAGASATSAAAASTSAAAAATSATVAASVGVRSMVRNPNFNDFPSTPGMPNYWSNWSNAASLVRVAGDVAQYAVRIPGLAAANSGIQQSTALGSASTDQWVVIEAQVKLDSGALTGAGAYMGIFNASSVQVGQAMLPFSTTPDNTGSAPGAGTVGRVYRFSKLFQLTGAAVSFVQLYATSHFTSFGSVAAANSLDWYQCSVRPATDQEIASNTATANIAALTASVSTISSATADINGRLSATYAVTVGAGDRFASLKLLTESGGGTTISTFDIQADKFRVWNGTSNIPAFEVSGGAAYVNGNLVRTQSVVDNAITDEVTAFTSGSASINTSDPANPFSTVQTAVITTTGKSVRIDASIDVSFLYIGGGTGVPGWAATIRLYRDATLIRQSTHNPPHTGGTGTNTAATVPVMASEIPSAGTYTYTIQVSRGGNGTSSIGVSNRYLALRETKK